MVPRGTPIQSRGAALNSCQSTQGMCPSLFVTIVPCFNVPDSHTETRPLQATPRMRTALARMVPTSLRSLVCLFPGPTLRYCSRRFKKAAKTVPFPSSTMVCAKSSHFRHGSSPDATVGTVDDKVIPIWNVLGVIPGHIKDEVVVVGNHRDGKLS